jgi:hypothetical protein
MCQQLPMRPPNSLQNINHAPSEGCTARSSRISLIALSLICGVLVARESQAQSLWTLSYPDWVSPDLNAVTYGNGLLVAVGYNGVVLTSSNGQNWTQGLVAPDLTLTGVTCGDAGFVAVGLHHTATSPDADWAGVIYTSPDAITWTQRLAQPFFGPRAIAFGNGTYVASGKIGMSWPNQPSPLWTSTNGVLWTEHPNLASPYTLHFASGTFLGVEGSTLWTSPDGDKWEAVNIPEVTNGVTLAGVTRNLDRWVAVDDTGKFHTSADGKDWSSVPFFAPGLVCDLTWAEGRFVAVGDSGLIVTSADGYTWQVSEPVVESYLSGITGCAQGFVAVGSGGSILLSTNSARWMLVGGASKCGLNAVASGNDGFVAVGNKGTILFSPDTVQWNLQDSPCTNDLRSVAFFSTHYVAVGTGGIIVRSHNGSSWERCQSALTEDLNDVTSTSRGFTAVSSLGTVIESLDGLVWSTRKTWTNLYLAALAYRPDELVILSHETLPEGFMFGNWTVGALSLDSDSWTSKTLTNYFMAADVAYAQNMYVGVGGSPASLIYIPDHGVEDACPCTAVILVSSNASVWSQVPISPRIGTMNGVAYGNGTWLAVGGSLQISEDAYAWRAATTAVASVAGFLRGLSGVAYGHGHYVAVGNTMVNGPDATSEAGTIWVSSSDLRIASCRLAPDRHMRLLLLGSPGTWAEIQSSTDLSHWEPIVILQVPENGISIEDPGSPASASRFYRAVQR